MNARTVVQCRGCLGHLPPPPRQGPTSPGTAPRLSAPAVQPHLNCRASSTLVKGMWMSAAGGGEGRARRGRGNEGAKRSQRRQAPGLPTGPQCGGALRSVPAPRAASKRSQLPAWGRRQRGTHLSARHSRPRARRCGAPWGSCGAGEADGRGGRRVQKQHLRAVPLSRPKGPQLWHMWLGGGYGAHAGKHVQPARHAPSCPAAASPVDADVAGDDAARLSARQHVHEGLHGRRPDVAHVHYAHRKVPAPPPPHPPTYHTPSPLPTTTHTCAQPG